MLITSRTVPLLFSLEDQCHQKFRGPPGHFPEFFLVFPFGWRRYLTVEPLASACTLYLFMVWCPPKPFCIGWCGCRGFPVASCPPGCCHVVNWRVLRSSTWGLELLCSMLVTERCTAVPSGQGDVIGGCVFMSLRQRVFSASGVGWSAQMLWILLLLLSLQGIQAPPKTALHR